VSSQFYARVNLLCENASRKALGTRLCGPHIWYESANRYEKLLQPGMKGRCYGCPSIVLIAVLTATATTKTMNDL